MTIYGWYEQNECSYGIVRHVIWDNDDINLLSGQWFRTLKEAKKACLAIWQVRKQTAINAIREIKETKIQ